MTRAPSRGHPRRLARHGVRRGFYTSFIRVTATARLFLSLPVILATRSILGEAAFDGWVWRVP